MRKIKDFAILGLIILIPLCLILGFAFIDFTLWRVNHPTAPWWGFLLN